jgi:hypothetical protein
MHSYGTGNFELCVWQSGAMPVSLLSFQAQLQKTNTHLVWRTASEAQNARFEVQHSRNGVSFQTIGTVAGHGTTTAPHDYEYTHERPGPGTHYYRLRQVDFVGAHSYSHIVSVDQTGQEDLLVLRLWPNPTTGVINIGADMPEGTHYTVSNMQGQLLLEGELGSAALDLSELRRGTYLLTCTAASKTWSALVTNN